MTTSIREQIEEQLEPFVQKWESEGRTEEQKWAVRNFLTGAGMTGIVALISKLQQEAEERGHKDGFNAGYKGENSRWFYAIEYSLEKDDAERLRAAYNALSQPQNKEESV